MTKILVNKELLKVKLNVNSRLRKTKVCEYCQEKFYTARASAKFCSNSCKQKNYRASLKE